MNAPASPRRCAAWLLFVCALSAVPGAAGAPATWRAGTARENITPPAGVWMTGYASRDKPAEGKAQDLWVKALAFADPAGTRGVLLTLDLCGISRQVSDTVAAALARSHGLPRSAVMTNVSHTHCSPQLEGNLRGIQTLPPDGIAKSIAYTRELEQKMIRAATAALAALAPVMIHWGGDEATFGFNRRENAEKDVVALRAAGKLKGPFDPRVPVLAVRTAAGELRALLVSYACHNTTLSFYQWHGDYAGAAMAELERRHPGATVLFAIGCGADINPGPRRELAHVESHGRALADAADRALAKPLSPVAGRLGTAFEDLTLTFSRRPTEAQLREAEVKQQPNQGMHRAWAASVRDLIPRLPKSPRILTTTVGSYPVPDWLAALPSEQAVIDATRVVFDIQRQAGIDLPTDGELYRFDVNHPDTNGMIEYFIRPMAGITGRSSAARSPRNSPGTIPWVSAASPRASSRVRSAKVPSTCSPTASAPRRSPAARSSSPSRAPTCWRARCSTTTTAASTSSPWPSPRCSPRRCPACPRPASRSTRPTSPATPRTPRSPPPR
jgi:hypothetical protein